MLRSSSLALVSLFSVVLEPFFGLEKVVSCRWPWFGGFLGFVTFSTILYCVWDVVFIRTCGLLDLEGR